ncbi:MAG: energy-coupling factor transporter transmembrane protein EcfT [Deltaproteobacteria bacterium]|nr:energy-coupling factor transporter transmembrane protein EcfT [Deltaproteobacteria bacterium]
MIRFGCYIPRESVVHGLDPRVKILSVIVFSLVILKAGTLGGVLITLFLAALIPMSGLSFSLLARSLRPAALFLLLLFIVHLLFTEGRPVPPFPSWVFGPTYEGLFKGATVTWEFSLLLVSASILTMTTTPAELINGIERILRPLKVLRIPSHDVAMMISIALRFLPTLIEDMARIKEAQMARGASFGAGSLFRRAKAAATLTLPLILGSLRRVEELATAMEARAYRRGPRTYLRNLRMSRGDYDAMAVVLTIALACALRGLHPWG